MPDTHYEDPRLAEIYDLDSPWSIDRDFYLALAGRKSASLEILDLGCGTGLLANAYAGEGHAVTGVDPSDAMLSVGRRKPFGDKIQWVCSQAQSYRSDTLFDLIIMTGHAFQVLLEDADISATFEMMRRQVKPDGLIVFESRNPDIDWASCWNYDMEFESPDGVVRESRTFLFMKDDRMSFKIDYRFADKSLVSFSELRFLSRHQIEERLSESGLRVEKLLGDWDSSPFDQNVSQEMIFIVQDTD